MYVTLTTRLHTSKITQRSVWSKGFHFQDKRGAASLSYRNAKIRYNEVYHILLLSETWRKKSSKQICISYLNLEKTHIYYVFCFMLFVDNDECLKTPPDCDINANCKNTLGSHLCSCKEGSKGDGKTCQGKIKKKNGTIQETPHVTYWSKRFYSARYDPHPFNFQQSTDHE